MSNCPNIIPGCWSGECELVLNAGRQAIRFNGKDYAPDDSTAYVEFRLAYAFPKGFSVYGDALLPEVVKASAGSIVDKPLNLAHKMKSYAPDQIHRDRVIGNIRDVEVVMEDGLPHLHVLASLFKAAEGVDRILGQHTGGRKQWNVSLEFLYRIANSGFVVQRAADRPGADTPAWLAQLGWDYVPIRTEGGNLFVEGEEYAGLIGLRDFKARKFTNRHAKFSHAGDMGGRAVYFAMNGLTAPGHFSGVGIVEHGAEVTARIERMLAGDNRVEAPLARLAATVKVFEKFGLPGL